MADAIERIDTAMKQVLSSRLKYKTLLVLLAHSSGLTQGNVEKVLDALDTLRKDYLKP